MAIPHEELKDILRVTISRLMQLSMCSFWIYAKEQGFSMTQMFTLRQIHIHKAQGGCNISMISGNLGVTNAAISQSLDHLVKQGLVLRIEDPQDRRNKRLLLTSKGRDALQGGMANQQPWMDAFLQQLNDDEATQLSAALVLLAEKLANSKTIKSSYHHNSNFLEELV